MMMMIVSLHEDKAFLKRPVRKNPALGVKKLGRGRCAWGGKRNSGLTIIIRLFLVLGGIDWGGCYKGSVAKERVKFIGRIGAMPYF